MIELQGKYAKAKVYTDNIEQGAIAQILDTCNQQFTDGCNISIMPDCHEGVACTIGTTMTLKDKVVPNLVGVDIGCGMLTIKLKERELDLNRLDEIINRLVPADKATRQSIHKDALKIRVKELKCLRAVYDIKAYLSVGTLGGGNHFIEIDKDSTGNLYLVIHTGSRYLGIQVCSYYQNAAYNDVLEKTVRAEIRQKTEEIKNKYTAEGRQKDIQGALNKLKKSCSNITINKDLCYCEGQLFNDYIHDMEIAQEFASLNRRVIANDILEEMGLTELDSFETVHNYIDTKNMILRKGAISAQEGEKVLIPLNMRDGSIIAIGKGNVDWNYSAPHGAGRLIPRGVIEEYVDMDEYKESMKGIYTTSINKSTLDESPMAYKPMEEIIKNIQDTVTILERIIPIYNYKANTKDGDNIPWYKKEEALKEKTPYDNMTKEEILECLKEADFNELQRIQMGVKNKGWNIDVVSVMKERLASEEHNNGVTYIK